MNGDTSGGFESELEASGRRDFLKKLAIGTAFVPPAVSSFTMTGISAVYAQTPAVSGQVDDTQVTNTTTSEPTTTTTSPNQTTTTVVSNQTTTTTNPNQTATTTTLLSDQIVNP